MNSQPIASVVLPAYNAESTLADSIASVRKQTFASWELIVVNDGSVDRTAAVVQELAAADERIRLINNETNQGLPRSLNRGLAACRGQYVIRMDGDDLAYPHRFQTQIDYLAAHPDIGACGASVHLIGVRGEALGTRRMYEEHDLICWDACFHSPVIHPTVALRRTLVDRGFTYSEHYPSIGEDYDLWVRLLANTRMANLPEPLLAYRCHPGQVSQARKNVAVNAMLIQKAAASLLRLDLLPEEALALAEAKIRQPLSTEGALLYFPSLLLRMRSAFLATCSPGARIRRAVEAHIGRFLLDFVLSQPALSRAHTIRLVASALLRSPGTAWREKWKIRAGLCRRPGEENTSEADRERP
jgi:hypothetical protein